MYDFKTLKLIRYTESNSIQLVVNIKDSSFYGVSFERTVNTESELNEFVRVVLNAINLADSLETPPLTSNLELLSRYYRLDMCSLQQCVDIVPFKFCGDSNPLAIFSVLIHSGSFKDRFKQLDVLRSIKNCIVSFDIEMPWLPVQKRVFNTTRNLEE